MAFYSSLHRNIISFLEMLHFSATFRKFVNEQQFCIICFLRLPAGHVSAGQNNKNYGRVERF